MKKIVYLTLLCMVFQASAMETKKIDISHARLCFVNKSGYDIEIISPSKITVYNGCSYLFARAPEQITFNRNNVIDIVSTLEKRCNKLACDRDVIVTLSPSWTGWNWQIDTEEKKNIVSASVLLPQSESSSAVWSVFPAVLGHKGKKELLGYVQELNSADPIKLSQYVLELGAGHSDEDLENAYNRQKSRASKSDKVLSIVNRAYDILKNQKVNFSEHILTQEQVEYAESGKALFKKLLNGEKLTEFESPKKCLTLKKKINKPGAGYLKRIVQLVWCLYQITLEKDQNFAEGTFVFQDPGFNIYNYLLGYVKKVKAGGCAYSRKSSHYELEQEKYGKKHYGIDIIKTSDNLSLPTFPIKRHILFGCIGEGCKVFLKPETHGLEGFVSVIRHGISFGQAQGRKIAPGTFGSDDSPLYRKERIPKVFIARCKEILEGSSSSDSPKIIKAKKHLIDQIKIKGIRILRKIADFCPFFLYAKDEGLQCSLLKKHGKEYVDAWQQRISDLVKKSKENTELYEAIEHLSRKECSELQQYFKDVNEQYDNIPLRSGREVIITRKELCDICGVKSEK